LIFLGKILKTRGNKGEVVCRPSFSINTPSHWEGNEILLKSAKNQRKATIEYIKNTKSGFILKLVSINTIREAFKLVGYSLYGIGIQGKESAVEDIIDFKVKDLDNVYWGIVFDIKKFGLNVILEIRNNDNTIYVPFDETIVIEIQKERKTIILDPPEGLFNLNQ
jgi:16S rRNA processing protein RimM